jgi:uncharacterized membrane protein HdeD (DUF308 family)
MIARRLPWWFPLFVGLVCVGLGGYLVADPFKARSVLASVAGVSLLLSGAAELAYAPSTARPELARAAGGAWAVAGLVAIAWPGITLLALALTTGIGLLAGGAAELLIAVDERGEARLLTAVAGAVDTVVGLTAIVWPGISVLALAVLLGVRTFLFGCAELTRALRGRRAPTRSAPPRRSLLPPAAAPRPVGRAAVLAAVALALAGTGTSLALHDSEEPQPGPFYAAPSPLPHGPPGTLIRSQEIVGFYPGAKAYRVLYKSTGFDGRPTAVSGVVIVPEAPPPPAVAR